MIIGKQDKERVEKLEDQNRELLLEINKLKMKSLSPKEDDRKMYIKFLEKKNKDYKEREEALLTVLKAIINKFGAKQIIVSCEEEDNAKRYKLVRQKEWLSLSNIYSVVDPQSILDSYKED